MTFLLHQRPLAQVFALSNGQFEGLLQIGVNEAGQCIDSIEYPLGNAAQSERYVEQFKKLYYRERNLCVHDSKAHPVVPGSKEQQQQQQQGVAPAAAPVPPPQTVAQPKKPPSTPKKKSEKKKSKDSEKKKKSKAKGKKAKKKK